MYRVLLSIFIIFTLSACMSTSNNIELEPKKSSSSKKVFEEEDFIILTALRAEELGEHNASSSMFNTLYIKSSKKEYLYRSLQNDLAAKEYERAIQRINFETQGSFEDFKLIRIEVVALIRINNLELARTTAMMLVEESQNVNDYLLVSDIYVRLGKYETALKYLESAYSKDFNEKILDKISIILYVNMNKKKDAIAHLESHSRIHGCSTSICNRLVSFYSEQNNIDGLLSVYLRLYEINKEKKIADKIVQIYGYQKDYIKLMDFLEVSDVNDELLLQLFIQMKKYTKASVIAQKLYDDTGEISYLGQSAIFEYEGSEDKSNTKMHLKVVEKLREVLALDKSALYLNYLGYLLIDHEIDIKSGMKYIDKALKTNPESAYYLDSRAWGYYKLGQCKKAKKLIKRVVKLDGGDAREVQEHYKIIQKCKQKKVKK